MSIYKKLSYRLWSISPKENFRRAKHLLVNNKTFSYNISELLDNKKHITPIYIIDRWERYLRNIHIKYPNLEIFKKISFNNKIFFELGSGPLLGWGPIFLFLGAKKFVFSEPAFNEEIYDSAIIEKKYFKVLFEDLVFNYGKLMDYETFIKKIKNDTINIKNSNNLTYDFVVSNSVLEHINFSEIQNIMTEINKKMSKDSYFIHSVDFSDHSTSWKEMYSKSINNNKKLINYLRFSEMNDLLKNIGFSSLDSVIHRTLKLENKKIHKDWDKYDNNDLKVMRVIFFGTKKYFKD